MLLMNKWNIFVYTVKLVCCYYSFCILQFSVDVRIPCTLIFCAIQCFGISYQWKFSPLQDSVHFIPPGMFVEVGDVETGSCCSHTFSFCYRCHGRVNCFFFPTVCSFLRRSTNFSLELKHFWFPPRSVMKRVLICTNLRFDWKTTAEFLAAARNKNSFRFSRKTMCLDLRVSIAL